MTDQLALAASAHLDTLLSEAVDPRSLPVRHSSLRCMAQSPSHYRWQALHGKEQTLAMRLGSGTHGLIFDKPVAVYPFVRHGKKWDEFEAAHHDVTILNDREYKQSLGIADAVRAHPEASRLLFDGTTIETPIDWSFMGRACRSTPDACNRDAVVELKTCRTADPERFMKQASWQHYHSQLAFYSMAIRNSIDVPCFIVAVESTPPHPVQVFRLSPKTLDKGWALCRGWFERLLACEEANVWPGYTEAVTLWDLDDDPDWLVFPESREE